jgi:hypothetical protein
MKCLSKILAAIKRLLRRVSLPVRSGRLAMTFLVKTQFSVFMNVAICHCDPPRAEKQSKLDMSLIPNLNLIFHIYYRPFIPHHQIPAGVVC